MKNLFMVNAEHEERSFGSALDPLLIGVAQGLANLFPPIETIRCQRAGDQAGHLHDAEDETSED